MKKKISFIIICLFFFMGITKAEDIFYYDWETIKTNTYYEELIDNISYNNGFITSGVEETDNLSGSILKKYDADGNIIKSNILNDYLVITLSNYNNNIYAISLNKDDNLVLLKIKDDLTIDKSLDLELSASENEDSISGLIEYKIYGIKHITEDANYIYILLEEHIIRVSKDMTSSEKINPTQEDLAEQFPEYSKIVLNSILNELQYFGVDTKGENIVYTGMKTEGCDSETTYCLEKTSGVIRLDSGENKLWEKEYSKYSYIVNPSFIGKYIIAVGVTETEQKSDVLVLDMEGNILQTITNNLQAIISSGNYNFMVNNISDTEELLQIVYYLQLNIATKVEGKGNVEVISTARDGEEVTFKITPEKGYVLGEVKVTDANGNVITFTSNTFTMPSADVTIEATFLPENPDTIDLIMYISLLFGLSLIFIIYIKKEKERKYYKK